MSQTVMQVAGVFGQHQLGFVGQLPKTALLATPDHAHRTFAARLGNRLGAPVAAVDVFRRLRFAAQQGHGHHGELLGRAALQQEHMKTPVDAQQRAHVVFEFLHGGGKPVGAVADAQHRQARAGHFQDGLLDFFQHARRQRARTAGKIQLVERVQSGARLCGKGEFKWIHGLHGGCQCAGGAVAGVAGPILTRAGARKRTRYAAKLPLLWCMRRLCRLRLPAAA